MSIQILESLAEASSNQVDCREHLIAEIVIAYVIPDGFNRVELRAVRRQQLNVHVLGHDEIMANVSTGTIEKHDAILERKSLLGLCEEGVHDMMVHAAASDHEGADAPLPRVDREHGIAIFTYLLVPDNRPDYREAPSKYAGC